MTRPLTIPERVLQDLGVEEPGDIDVEAIAWHLGAEVRYRKLHNCEARIVGLGDEAIISVDEDVEHRRRRFSIGHELGHWRHHRSRCLACRTEQIGDARKLPTDPERVADDYASDLLLPRFLLEPMLRKIARPTLKDLRTLSDAFDASLTATTLKVVETDRYPMMVICHGLGGRRWFRASRSVPKRWFPRDRPDPESCASSIVDGEEPRPRRIDADAWFDRVSAADYTLLEQSFRLPDSQVATVLLLSDDMMD